MIGNSVASAADYWYLVTNNVERLRVTGSGNVGIGTTTPGQILTVSGGSIQIIDGTQ